MRRFVGALSLVLAVLALPSVSVAAQAPSADSVMSNTSGAMLDLHANGTSLSVEDTSMESRGELGLRLDDSVTPVLGLDVVKVDGVAPASPDYGALSQIDLGLQDNVTRQSRAPLPSLLTAVASRGSGSDVSGDVGNAMRVDARGGSTLDGGLAYHVWPGIALNGMPLCSFGDVDGGKVDGSSIARLSASAAVGGSTTT